MVFWICQKWSFPWWSLKLLSQITDLKHFKQNWLKNFRLHQWKDHFWQIEKTMHQFCSVQLYPELTNQAETNQNIPQKLWRRVEKSGFWRLIIMQLLSLDDSGTRRRLRLCIVGNWFEPWRACFEMPYFYLDKLFHLENAFGESLLT